MTEMFNQKLVSKTLTILITVSILLIILVPGDLVHAINQCGGHLQSPVTTSIDIGCKKQGNPIADLSFAIIRFLSDGVGLIIVGSLVVAGIQYTSSRGDPQLAAKAVGRIRATVVALLIYIFAYAMLNFVIPGDLLK